MIWEICLALQGKILLSWIQYISFLDKIYLIYQPSVFLNRSQLRILKLNIYVYSYTTLFFHFRCNPHLRKIFFLRKIILQDSKDTISNAMLFELLNNIFKGLMSQCFLSGIEDRYYISALSSSTLRSIQIFFF